MRFPSPHPLPHGEREPRLRGLALRIALILGAACLCGAVANRVLPTRIPWTYAWSHDVELRAASEKIALVSLEEARGIVESGTQLVFDARTKPEFGKGHLPGAFSVPYNDVAAALSEVGMLLTRNQPLLVYCAGRDCDEGLLLCLRLREQGFRGAALFLDGYRAWAGAKLPVEAGS